MRLIGFYPEPLTGEMGVLSGAPSNLYVRMYGCRFLVAAAAVDVAHWTGQKREEKENME